MWLCGVNSFTTSFHKHAKLAEVKLVAPMRKKKRSSYSQQVVAVIKDWLYEDHDVLLSVVS